MSMLKLTIVTPSGEIYNGEVDNVILPGTDGEFEVLPHHSSLISTLSRGVVEFRVNDQIEAIALNWGYVKVGDNTVDLLADSVVSITTSEDSLISDNIQKALELVKSVKDSNYPMAAIESKMNSYKK